jgi:hypothetical protein
LRSIAAGDILDRGASLVDGVADWFLVSADARQDKKDHQNGRYNQHQQCQQAGAVSHHSTSPSDIPVATLEIANDFRRFYKLSQLFRYVQAQVFL